MNALKFRIPVALTVLGSLLACSSNDSSNSPGQSAAGSGNASAGSQNSTSGGTGAAIAGAGGSSVAGSSVGGGIAASGAGGAGNQGGSSNGLGGSSNAGGSMNSGGSAGTNNSGGSGGTNAGGYKPEDYSSCAMPVIYVAQEPKSARVMELEAKLGGAAGVEKVLSMMPLKGCWLLYASPADAAKYVHPGARIVMNIGPMRWPSDSSYTDPSGKNWYDYGAGDMDAISPDGDLMVQAFGACQHEVTHLLTPPGDKHPKWMEESFADYVRDKVGLTDDASVRPTAQAEHYCNGYNTGSYFFQWIDGKQPGFVNKLTHWIGENKDNPWPGGYPVGAANSEQVFSTVSGGTGLATFWSQYEATLSSPPGTTCGSDMWANY